MRINVSVFFASFLVGCSTVPSTKSTGVSEQFKEYGCEIDNDHFTQDREYVETGLKCVKKVS
ncbi:TPA: hypothetical protein I7769_21935, partial [Vibrio vulnificus]|nr:hypothetical protein [Vibrio vulnificus]